MLAETTHIYLHLEFIFQVFCVIEQLDNSKLHKEDQAGSAAMLLEP